jgi:superfamily II DNA or RNA helicase
LPTKSSAIPLITPGAQVVVRDEDWLVRAISDTTVDGFMVKVTGLSELVQDTEATFFTSIDDIEPVRPEDTTLVLDETGGYRRSRLWMEAVLRKAPVPVSDSRLTVSHQQLLADLRYQRVPVHKALEALRPRLLVADAVGLGKTLEIGMILSELIRRGRGERILVVTPRAILEQFQHEMWTRFSIGLVRLDSEGIQKVRQKIPPTRNPFTYFKRVIISIDTLKQAGRYRHQLENVNWDAVVIDEVHNLINSSSQRNTLARVLAPRTDALILASATPHNGKTESFAELVRLLDPAAISNPKTYKREQVQHLYVQRFKKDVSAEVGANFADRMEPKSIGVHATEAEEAVLADIADHWVNRDTSVCADRLFPWTLLKAALSSPPALRATLGKRVATVAKQESTPQSKRELEALDRLSGLANAIGSNESAKLRALIEVLTGIGIGPKEATRVVIFSERVDTVQWLAAELPAQLGLKTESVEVLHAGLPEQEQLRVIEAFGQADRPVRVLVTTDISSEGVNLHRQCHHLLHFDVPWSLIRVQQRNGRIDRYGQMHRPEIRALLLRSKQHSVSDEQRVAERLLEREHEAQRTLGDVAPILGKYSAIEEENLILAGLASGKNAEAIVPNDPSDGFDLLSFLTEGVAAPKDVPLADVPRLVVDDWAFLKEGLAEVVVDPKRELDLVIDEGRRFAAFNPPRDLKARLQLLPDEVLRERKIADRLKLTADKDEAEEKLREAREHDRSESMWPDVGWLGAHHPLFDWLVDKLLARFGRNEAPVLQAKVKVPTYLVQTMFANKRGQPTIVEWLAIENAGPSDQRIRPMFDVLREAEVGPSMPNPGGLDAEVIRGLQGSIKMIVKAADDRAKEIRDERRVQLDDRVRDELSRVAVWKQEALAVSETSTRRERVERTYTDLSTYIESLRTEGNPYVRIVGVLLPLVTAAPNGTIGTFGPQAKNLIKEKA